MDLLVGILVIFIALLVLGWVLSAMAKSQKALVVRADPQLIADTINGHFGKVWWPPAKDGPGQFNFRARGFGLGGIMTTRPVLSIDLEASPGGGTEVQVWMSSFGHQVGIIALADRVVLKRLSLFRRLRALETPSVAAT